MERTDELDAHREVRARAEAEAGARHLPAIRQAGAVSHRQPAAPLTRMAPADQVVVGDIPAQRPGFLPRPALLAQLNRASQGTTPVVQVLAGRPGTGKTQLAAAFARAKLAGGWRLVAWVTAEDLESLLAGLSAVADAVGLSDGAPHRGEADPGRQVRHWLEADGDGCLLVFDDARDPDVLRPYIPVAGAARVLITAAAESVADLGTSVPVDAFTAEEALALLDGRTGLADEAGATAVVDKLGCLPLAVDQAAAVVARQRLGYGAYLGRLRTLPTEEYLIREENHPYPQGAGEAVLISLEAVRTADQASVCTGVLQLMAVLSAAGVPRDLLRAAGQAGALILGGHRVAAAQVDHALALLAGRCLVTFSLDGQSVIMHRLVARVVRDGLVRQQRLTAVGQAAAAVLEAYAQTPAGSRDRAAVRGVPQQVTALQDNASGPGGEPGEELTGVLLRLRFLALRHLIELGDSMPQAIAVGEPLSADLERLLGPVHPDTMTAQASLAGAYQAAGRTGSAIPLFEQILVGQVRLLGPDHPDTLTAQNNLAAAYRDEGRFGEATLLYKLTLAIRERLLGAGHPATLSSRDDLAGAYQAAGRAGSAVPLLEQILAGRERLLGADHPDTLRSHGRLAAAYQAAGRAAEAIPLVEQVLTAQERTLGPDHPKTLRSRNNLAAAYLEAGRAAEAIPLLEHTLAACERLLGADDPETWAARNNLSLAYRDTGASPGAPLGQLAAAAAADADRDGAGETAAGPRDAGEDERDPEGLGGGDVDGPGERAASGPPDAADDPAGDGAMAKG